MKITFRAPVYHISGADFIDKAANERLFCYRLRCPNSRGFQDGCMQISDFPDLAPSLKDGLLRALQYQHEGRLFEADRLYAQMASRRPVHPLLAHTIGGFRLLKGDFSGAWAMFERRLELPYYTHRPFARLAASMWDGTPIPGGRLLVFADLGLGDTILLSRFLPWVQNRVGALALHVNPGTKAFWRKRLPGAEVNELEAPLPASEARINMFCLPRLVGADTGNIPPAPYLKAEEDERARWRDRLDGDFRVGVAWQGNPDHARDWERSMPLSAMAPILTDRFLHRAGVRFFSLQVAHGREQLAALPAGTNLQDLGADIMAAEDSLEATAALVAELDLVICVDSALANLVGAMGRPFWLPTYKVPDWRWSTFPDLDLEHASGAPWYRSHKVYACAQRGQWAPVMAQMHSDLNAMASNKKR